MDNPTIRLLLEEDWYLIKRIRLEALQKHPEFFCPSQDEFAFTEEKWRSRLRDANGATFGLFVGEEIVGISTVSRANNQPSARQAELVGSYIRSEYRGQGLSRLFHEARIDWAKAQGDIDTLIVEVQEDNRSSLASHIRYGFAFVEKRCKEQRDGSALESLVFALDLSS